MKTFIIFAIIIILGAAHYLVKIIERDEK